MSTKTGSGLFLRASRGCLAFAFLRTRDPENIVASDNNKTLVLIIIIYKPDQHFTKCARIGTVNVLLGIGQMQVHVAVNRHQDA